MVLENSVLEMLRSVHVDLTRATDADTTSLALPRARLAWIATLIPPECEQQRYLLDTAAQVAAEIGLGRVGRTPDAVRLQATVAAVRAVFEYFANPASEEGRRMTEDATRQLSQSGRAS